MSDKLSVISGNNLEIVPSIIEIRLMMQLYMVASNVNCAIILDMEEL